MEAISSVRKLSTSKLFQCSILTTDQQKQIIGAGLSKSVLTVCLLLLMVACSVHVTEGAGACPRTITRLFDCPQYYNAYNGTYNVTQVLKVMDGISAQRNYITSSVTGLENLFNPNRLLENSKLKTAVQSILKLNRLRGSLDKLGDLGGNTEVIKALFNHSVKEACRWLKSHNLPVGNCTDNSLLEQLDYRLQFADVLYETLLNVKRIAGHNCFSFYVDFCAWMNFDVLDSCRAISTSNSTLYQSLNRVCQHESAIPRGNCRQISLCAQA